MLRTYYIRTVRIPRLNAGASLKPGFDLGGFADQIRIPRLNAGASLKRVAAGLGEEAATEVFPGLMPGPH